MITCFKFKVIGIIFKTANFYLFKAMNSLESQIVRNMYKYLINKSMHLTSEDITLVIEPLANFVKNWCLQTLKEKVFCKAKKY